MKEMAFMLLKESRQFNRRIKRRAGMHTKAEVIVMSKASVYFTLGDSYNKQDAKAIKRELDALPGVRSVSVSDSVNRVAVDFDTSGVRSERIQKRLEAMGYQVLSYGTDNHIM